MKNIFEGLRVIDFTSYAAGPVSTASLADFGAEILKIEKPGVGDDTRALPPDLDGVVQWFCRNGRYRGEKTHPNRQPPQHDVPVWTV